MDEHGSDEKELIVPSTPMMDEFEDPKLSRGSIDDGDQAG